MTLRLYVLQRMTAALMVPLIIGHLIVIFYATSNGLSAAEILGRTRGSIGWALYYGLFVILASVHGAIGVRGVLREWTRLTPGALDAIMWAFGLLLAILGARAVAAVALP
jgi:fumarate reductase subunit C